MNSASGCDLLLPFMELIWINICAIILRWKICHTDNLHRVRNGKWPVRNIWISNKQKILFSTMSSYLIVVNLVIGPNKTKMCFAWVSFEILYLFYSHFVLFFFAVEYSTVYTLQHAYILFRGREGGCGNLVLPYTAHTHRAWLVFRLSVGIAWQKVLPPPLPFPLPPPRLIVQSQGVAKKRH
jgi:hypothetical protein